MNRPAPLLIPDLPALRRKLSAPRPELAELLGRFRRRLDSDEKFRANNIFLLALLGEPGAVAEARRLVRTRSLEMGAWGPEHGGVEHHTWCVAPDIMRYAAYATWLDFGPAEVKPIAEALVNFCYEHIVAVLRSRVPAGNNQSLSMALTCAVVGAAFPGEERAAALCEYGRAKLIETLRLFSPTGYSGEGSTYQSHVISPLLMWCGAFLPEERDRILRLLQLESYLGSPGGLLAPWDHYGWLYKINLAAIAYWATATNQPVALADAGRIWDRDDFIAWNTDDRMWTLIYWPDAPVPARPVETLTGWTMPGVGAALDHHGNRSRVMMVWDSCADDLQGLGRGQVNPNHVMYDVGGAPVFGDGIAEPGARFLGVTAEQIAAPLTAAQRQLVIEQYGGLEGWVENIQPGLIGAANTVVLDGEVAYFPPGARRGQLVCEQRAPDRHLVTAESAEYYRPRYDVERARRTVAHDATGLVWIVDDYRAASEHTFTWQLYLRQGIRLDPSHHQCHSEQAKNDKPAVTLAWLPGSAARLVDVPGFPKKAHAPEMAWPESGSQRLTLEQRGRAARFVVVLLPQPVGNLRVTALSDRAWRAEWDGGSATLELPAACEAPVKVEPVEMPVVEDLDAPPFALLDEPDETLLADLREPSPAAWRRTTAAMQTLANRQCAAALPLIHKLLVDPTQRYQVHSVAAWCLGRLRYRPALADLRLRCESPEMNTAWRSRWAVARMG